MPLNAPPDCIVPSQYDVLLTDICEEDLKFVCSELARDYLSVRENKAEFPVSGMFHGVNCRLFVCLPVENGDIKLNLPFVIVTGVPYTYVTRDVFEKLGYSENCPSSVTMRVNGGTLMDVNASVGHFEHVNVLGRDFFRSNRLKLSVDYKKLIVLISK